jgi:hypothetical protein
MAIGRMQMNRQLYAEGTGILQASQAKDMLQRVAPRGEFLAYINPEEAGILRALGGAGEDINGTGIPSFFVKKAFKSVTKAVKKIASSPIGQIALAVAAPYAIGAFAPGFATLGGTGAFGAALRGGISNIGISALTGQKINPRNVLASAALSGGLQGLQTRFGGTTPTATDPGIAIDSIFAQPGTEGTFTYSDMGDDIINLSPGSITPTGQIVSGTPVQNQLALDQLAKQSAVTTGSGEVAKQATRGYMDITKDLFSGNFTKMGSAATELGGKALKTIYTNKDGSVDKAAVLATLSAIPSYLDAKKAADEAGVGEFDEATYNAERDKYMERYKANLPASSFGIQAAANGGRIGYKEGTPREGIVSLTDEDSGVIYRDPKTGEPLTTTEFLRRAQEDEDRENQEGEDKELDYGASSITLPKKKTFRERSMELAVPKQINRELEDKFENYLKKLVTGKKDGGRIGYQEGGGPLRPMVMSDRRVNNNSNMAIMPFVSPTLNTDNQGRLVNSITGVPLNRELMPEPAAAARSVDTTRGASVNQLFNYYKNKEMDEARRQQIIDLFMRDNAATGGRMGFMMGTEVPMRQNQGGITELDYRKTGGFVPVGVKEKADDVPAMLSKNEFVFTADAVRGAGKGDINKGAKMMYAKMKALEGKVKKFKKTKKKKVKV